jgi:hypothetical protein
VSVKGAAAAAAAASKHSLNSWRALTAVATAPRPDPGLLLVICHMQQEAGDKEMNFRVARKLRPMLSDDPAALVQTLREELERRQEENANGGRPPMRMLSPLVRQVLAMPAELSPKQAQQLGPTDRVRLEEFFRGAAREGRAPNIWCTFVFDLVACGHDAPAERIAERTRVFIMFVDRLLGAAVEGGIFPRLLKLAVRYEMSELGKLHMHVLATDAAILDKAAFPQQLHEWLQKQVMPDLACGNHTCAFGHICSPQRAATQCSHTHSKCCVKSQLFVFDSKLGKYVCMCRHRRTGRGTNAAGKVPQSRPLEHSPGIAAGHTVDACCDPHSHQCERILQQLTAELNAALLPHFATRPMDFQLLSRLGSPAVYRYALCYLNKGSFSAQGLLEELLTIARERQAGDADTDLALAMCYRVRSFLRRTASKVTVAGAFFFDASFPQLSIYSAPPPDLAEPLAQLYESTEALYRFVCPSECRWDAMAAPLLQQHWGMLPVTPGALRQHEALLVGAFIASSTLDVVRDALGGSDEVSFRCWLLGGFCAVPAACVPQLCQVRDMDFEPVPLSPPAGAAALMEEKALRQYGALRQLLDTGLLTDEFHLVRLAEPARQQRLTFSFCPVLLAQFRVEMRGLIAAGKTSFNLPHWVASIYVAGQVWPADSPFAAFTALWLAVSLPLADLHHLVWQQQQQQELSAETLAQRAVPLHADACAELVRVLHPEAVHMGLAFEQTTAGASTAVDLLNAAGQVEAQLQPIKTVAGRFGEQVDWMTVAVEQNYSGGTTDGDRTPAMTRAATARQERLAAQEAEDRQAREQQLVQQATKDLSYVRFNNVDAAVAKRQLVFDLDAPDEEASAAIRTAMLPADGDAVGVAPAPALKRRKTKEDGDEDEEEEEEWEEDDGPESDVEAEDVKTKPAPRPSRWTEGLEQATAAEKLHLRLLSKGILNEGAAAAVAAAPPLLDDENALQLIVAAILEEGAFTVGQQNALLRLLELLLDDDLWKSGAGASVLLQGTAGTGKSYVVQRFFRLVAPLKLRVALYSGLGKVALVSGGDTSAGGLFSLGQAAGPDGLEYLTQTLASKAEMLRQLHVLVFEESGQQGLLQFALLDTVLRAVTGRLHAPFGGIIVVLCGEVLQLRPIGKALPQTAPLSRIANPFLRATHMALFPPRGQPAAFDAELAAPALAPLRRILVLFLVDSRRYEHGDEYAALRAFSMGAHSEADISLIVSRVRFVCEEREPVTAAKLLSPRRVVAEAARRQALPHQPHPPLTRLYLAHGTRVRCSNSVRRKCLYAGMTGTVVAHVQEGEEELVAVVVSFDETGPGDAGGVANPFISQRDEPFFECAGYRRCAVVRVQEQLRLKEGSLSAGAPCLQNCAGSTIHACQGDTFSGADGLLAVHYSPLIRHMEHGLKYVPLSRPVELRLLLVAGVTRTEFHRLLLLSRPPAEALAFVANLAEAAHVETQQVMPRVAALLTPGQQEAVAGIMQRHAGGLADVLDLIRCGQRAPSVWSLKSVPLMQPGQPGPIDGRADLELLAAEIDAHYTGAELHVTHRPCPSFEDRNDFGVQFFRAVIGAFFCPAALWVLLTFNESGRALRRQLVENIFPYFFDHGLTHALAIFGQSWKHAVKAGQRVVVQLIERDPSLHGHGITANVDFRRIKDKANSGQNNLPKGWWSWFFPPDAKNKRVPYLPPRLHALPQPLTRRTDLSAPGVDLVEEALQKADVPAPDVRHKGGRPTGRSKRKRKKTSSR